MTARSRHAGPLLSALCIAATVVTVGCSHEPGADTTAQAAHDAARAAAGATTRAATVGLASVAPRETLTVEERARRLSEYGVIVNLDDGTAADSGSFLVAELRDTTRTLADLGFVPAAVLLDTATRLEAYGDSAAPIRMRLGSTHAADSASREASACTVAIPAHVRPPDGLPRPWRLVLAPGAAEVVPVSAWRRSADANADRALALRLASELELTAAERNRQALQDPAFATAPARVRIAHRFEIGDREYLLADVRRERTAPGGAEVLTDEPAEQRLFLAERERGDPAASFRVVWHHYDLANPDDRQEETPTMLLRLGRERLLTLYVVGDYGDGIGGRFISRVNGRWVELASWYDGC